MILLPVIWFAFWIVVALAAGFVAAALMSAQPDNGGPWLEAGTDKIPQMPNLGGKPTRFHLPTLRKWWLTYFQKGGEA